jgi:hypothetical protein
MKAETQEIAEAGEEELTPMQKCAALFAAQHAVATDRQVRATGISVRQQKSLIASEVWTRQAPGVVGPSGAPNTWERRVMTAILAVPGAVACGRTAARLHSLDGFRRFDQVKIAVARGSRIVKIAGVKYTRMNPLTAEDAVVINGISVTNVAVTLIHLAAGGHNAGKAMDDALRRGNRPNALRDVFQRWKGHGVKGPSVALELLADRVDRRLPRSWFQRMAKDLFAAEAVHLVDEWPVYDTNGKRLAELDLANVDIQVGVECQSWEWHGSPSAKQRDLTRKRRLRLQGWEIVDVWWSDLPRMAEVLVDVRLAISIARARKLAADPTRSV